MSKDEPNVGAPQDGAAVQQAGNRAGRADILNNDDMLVYYNMSKSTGNRVLVPWCGSTASGGQRSSGSKEESRPPNIFWSRVQFQHRAQLARPIASEIEHFSPQFSRLSMSVERKL